MSQLRGGGSTNPNDLIITPFNLDDWVPLFSHPTKMAVTKNALPLTTSKQGKPIIVRGDYAATLPYLPREWLLDFKFMPIKFTDYSYSEFFLHMTVGGRGYGEYVTSLYRIRGNNRKNELFVKFAANNRETVTKNLSTLTLNEWIHIEISQELMPGKATYLYKVEINGDVALAMENSQDKYFENVKVYPGHPRNQYISGYIKDLVIMAKPDKV